MVVWGRAPRRKQQACLATISFTLSVQINSHITNRKLKGPTHSGYFKRSSSDIGDTEYVAPTQPPSFTPGGATSFTGDGQRGLEPVDEHTESPSISSVHHGVTENSWTSGTRPLDPLDFGGQQPSRSDLVHKNFSETGGQDQVHAKAPGVSSAGGQRNPSQVPDQDTAPAINQLDYVGISLVGDKVGSVAVMAPFVTQVVALSWECEDYGDVCYSSGGFEVCH
uniref:Uncharacterized protein n=1 Tax=Tanacetum cinerariifolium TaxID=118510 RepID=A0A6L2NDJ6_TANCI|nr:hypothetical protein [Tanacetum cinerariifolium]